MDKDLFKKGIKNIRSFKLTKEERNKIFENLSKYADIEKVEKKQRFYSFDSNIEWFVLLRRAGAVSLVVALFFGTAVVFASTQSLPGDILYPVKVNVVEPIRGAVAVTQSAKIEWEAEKADTRLKEAEALSKKGKLNDVARKEIETRFAEHATKFDDFTEQKRGSVGDNKASSEKIKARINFIKDVAEHTKALDEIKDTVSTTEQKDEVENFKNNVLQTVDNIRNKRRESDDKEEIKSGIEIKIPEGGIFRNRNKDSKKWPNNDRKDD